MEAESVEDKGEGILCCVYVYNVQPGININYATGDSSASGTNKTAVTEQATQAVTQAASQQTSTESYILNTNTKKFHRPSCSSVKQMKESNKKYGQTLLLVTHDENIALQADRIISIEDGHIAKDEVIRP